MSNEHADLAQKRARQTTTLRVVGAFLIVIGLVVLLFLERMPLPLRMLVGLGDVFAGSVLLVAARQHSGR